MNPILITGASGFLGKRLVQHLRSSRESLRLLSRGPTPWDGDPDIEVVRGDVRRFDDVARATAGAAGIYHLAGLVSRNPADGPEMYRTHIVGARNVCEAARRSGGIKVVLVSSSGTIAVSSTPVIHREDSGYKLEAVRDWPYYLSKIFAEKVALEHYRRDKLPVVIVNPSLLLGPGDERRSSTADLALFLKGQILALPRGGLNFVDVRDAAVGVAAAMLRGRPGERYLLGGANWTFEEFIRAAARLSRHPAPRLKTSGAIALIGARALRVLFPLVGKSFDLSDVSINMSSLFWYCDSAKAKRELGFTTRDPMETLKDTLDDLRLRLR